MYTFPWKVFSLAVFAVSLGCGGGGESALEKSLGPPTKKLSELKQSAPEMSKEELQAARRAAGFKSRDEIAAENAAEFDPAARTYIRARTKEYRGLLGDLRQALEGLEKAAAKWPQGKKAPSKKAQKAFDKFAENYRAEMKEFTTRYNELTGQGAEGGATQAVFSKTFRTLEDLNNDLNPQIASQERFASTLEDIRKGFDEVEKAVEEIEKDEALVSGAGYAMS